MTSPHWLVDVLRVLDDNDVDFTCVAPGPVPNPNKPLVVWIHPGDAVEDRDDLSHLRASQRDNAMDYARACQQGMGAEILELGDTVDLVVLHRTSSLYAVFERSPDRFPAAFTQALDAAGGQTVLWGDDLENAAAWIATRLAAADRPHVLVTGAYSETKHGCVADIGRRLAAAGASVLLSAHAYVGLGGQGKVWVP